MNNREQSVEGGRFSQLCSEESLSYLSVKIVEDGRLEIYSALGNNGKSL